MPSEQSITETRVGRGRWEERGVEGKPQDPHHSICLLPDSLQVMQRISRMMQPTIRMEMPVMKTYTHRGMYSVASRIAWCSREAWYASSEVLQPLGWPLGPAPWHAGDLIHSLGNFVCLARDQAQSGTSDVAPKECPLGSPAAHYGKDQWPYLQSDLL